MTEKTPDPTPRPGFSERLRQLFGRDATAGGSGGGLPDPELEGQDRSDPFAQRDTKSEPRVEPERSSWFGRLRGLLSLESLHDGDREVYKPVTGREDEGAQRLQTDTEPGEVSVEIDLPDAGLTRPWTADVQPDEPIAADSRQWEWPYPVEDEPATGLREPEVRKPPEGLRLEEDFDPPVAGAPTVPTDQTAPVLRAAISSSGGEAGGTPTVVPPMAGQIPTAGPGYAVPTPMAGQTPTAGPGYAVPTPMAGQTPTAGPGYAVPTPMAGQIPTAGPGYAVPTPMAGQIPTAGIGRASCRERV